MQSLRQSLQLRRKGALEVFDLSAKVSLVTGAGSGIGAATAISLARQGARVVVADIDLEAAAAVADSIGREGGQAISHLLDVTDSDQCVSAVDRAVTTWSRLDVLVNNAGVGHVGSILEAEPADVRRLLDVNVMGVYHCARAAIRVMIDQDPRGGVVINVSSAAALVGLPLRFAYSTSKGAVLSLTRQIAIDFAGTGIRANAVCPGTVDTPFVHNYLKRFHAGEESTVLEQIRRRQPIGRLGTAPEIAACIVYLASDEGAFVSGAALSIDGGLTAQ